MKLVEIDIRRLPGIAAPFRLSSQELGPHVILIHGPNAAGKSSLVRALRALLWPGRDRSREMELGARFEADGRTYTVERHADHVTWRTNGDLSAPPGLPPSHLAACYTIDGDDLFGGDGPMLAAKDEALAAEIARQMAGGFDLRALREPLDSAARPGRVQERRWREALTALRLAEREHAALDGERAELESLLERKQRAEAAGRRVRDLETALELRRVRDEVHGLEVELGTFPSGMQEFRGDELERLEALDSKLTDERLAIDRFDQESERARRIIEDSGLPTDGSSSGKLEELRQRVRSIEHSEIEIAKLACELEGALQALEARRKTLHPSGAPHVDAASLERAEAFLRRAERLSRERAELDGELALHGEARVPGDVDAHAEGMRLLMAWLSVPDVTSRARDSARWVLLAWIGIASMLLGVLVHPAGYALIALAGAADVLLRARSPAAKAGRSEHQAAYARLDIVPPASWSRESIEARLQELHRERAAAELQRAEHARAERLRRRRAELDVESAEVERERREIAHALGIAIPSADLVLSVLARNAIVYQDAEVECIARRSRLQAAQSEHDEAARELSTELRAFGVEGASDAAALSGAVATLAERSASCARARAALEAATSQRAQSTRRVDGLGDERAKLLAIAGDERELTRRLEGLPAWKRAQAALASAQSSARSLSRKLDGAPELVELPREQLEAEIEESRTAADERDGFMQRMASITARVEAFEKQHGLEEALANVQASSDALRESCETALDDAATLWLLERIEDEAQQTVQSPVFKRAAATFAKFTHHAFELQISAAGGNAPTFRALDTSAGEKRALHELSSGTRAQLLLAARVAFAAESEHGLALPLVLDEALANSDPQRFAQIARSLSTLARDEGRQVIYMTSDPLDVVRWREAAPDGDLAVVDLERVRGVHGGADASRSMRPAAHTTPAAAGLTAEEYARVLGVPAVDPYAAVESLHLYYLLFDDLVLLQHLLDLRLQTLGQLRSFARTADWQTYVSKLEMDRIESWAAVYDATMHAWRIGRGRRFGRADLESAGVSDKFIASLCAIAAEVDWNAKQFLAQLVSRSDERLKGWRENKTTGVGEYLSEQGYLDAREPLPENDVIARALSVGAQSVAEGCISGEQVAERAAWLFDVFNRGSASNVAGRSDGRVDARVRA